MADTTSLDDLPTDPLAGGKSENIVLQTTDKPSQYNPNVEATSTSTEMNKIDEQKMMNEFVTGIQQASASGATNLPSRDIPQNTVHFADEQVKPNFVPDKEQSDYIQNTDTEQEILARRMKNQNSRDSLEILYDEFQIPIIIGLLFFIFQLPIVKNKFLSIFPSLHSLDGNPNLSGFILTSLFFGACYYVISKSLVHFQSI
jgi:hypothetical protein